MSEPVAAESKITLIRVKRKRSIDTPEDLVVDSITTPSSKRAHVSLAEQLSSLEVDHEAAAAGADAPSSASPSKRRHFKRLTTLSAAQISSLSQAQLQGLLATQRAARLGVKAVPPAAAVPHTAERAAALQAARSTARFEQVRRRRGLTNFERTEAAADPLREWSHVYDVICQSEAAEEEAGGAAQAGGGSALGGQGRSGRRRGQAPQYDEGTLLCNYLPMVREYLAGQGRVLPPTPEERAQQAAAAVAAGEPGSSSAGAAGDGQALATDGSCGDVDEYVYDLYAVASDDDDMAGGEEGREGRQQWWEAHTSGRAPVVTIVDDDTWLVLERSDGEDSDARSDDSNAEGYYAHDYPDEQSSDSDSDGFGHDPEGFRPDRAAQAWSESGSDSDGGKDSRPFY